MADSVEVLEFILDEEVYALDLLLVREIFETVPVTPIPRSPAYVSGVINMRGEITYILNIRTLLDMDEPHMSENKNIIVFTPETAEGTNIGIGVDRVTNVAHVSDSQIESRIDMMRRAGDQHIRGIIRLTRSEGEESDNRLVIWLDFKKILESINKR